MGIARSTFYDATPVQLDDIALVEAMAAICEGRGSLPDGLRDLREGRRLSRDDLDGFARQSG
jgi:hypothetical protein